MDNGAVHVARGALHVARGTLGHRNAPQRFPKGAKGTQNGAKGCQKGAKGNQMGAQRRPKSIPKFAPGLGAARPRCVLGLGVSVCLLPSMHPFLSSRFSFCRFPFQQGGFCNMLAFFLGGFHPGSLPFPPLSAVFWSPFGYFARPFG